jgi:hypothetical protein
LPEKLMRDTHIYDVRPFSFAPKAEHGSISARLRIHSEIAARTETRLSRSALRCFCQARPLIHFRHGSSAMTGTIGVFSLFQNVEARTLVLFVLQVKITSPTELVPICSSM